MSIEEIGKNLKHCYDDDIPDNMVGAAMTIDVNGSHHAAIFLRYNGESKLFHFDGRSVSIEDVSGLEEYYQKQLNFIEPILLPSFFAQCELILEKAQPQFGFFYEGSLYNEEGDFKSPSHSPEYMTCVGFCLNVIKGFLSDEEFLSYDEWDESSLDGVMEYVELFLEKVKATHPSINIDDFKVNLRRITPIEYLSGAFSDEIPVKKSFIDSIAHQVLRLIEEKKVA